ncbi:MAG: hemerythrin domain-containing protein [Candidatus Rokubacteria bacterium]|nr:hemerythrin domain-containing protein [Candidatus Rokubacteria bacterium]
MSEVTKPATGADQIVAEHQQIRQLAATLETATELEDLLRRLQHFRTTIVPHFLAEEGADGLYDTIRSLSPRQLGRVRQLEQEHRSLLEDIDRVAQRARDCLAGPVAEVLAEASALARRVRKHEAAENNMLLDTMYLDLGQGD